ncbi:MAG: CoA-substrate-specific enzyme activase [candidate division CPR2 bacterium GW2011_GWC1_39_9]|uniref:CoA-substrate-specific enzyme activase n=1 Tax=candidate division CPR2 bacterium GW2011_GWC2_39_10 TaxID=1618345 RepID=A0A0G0M3Z9_UNCC2|nr:MAG: CoA-substrate-specific enzyme activase [candidate division CPR2 bacterium GW2011_GWC2_39_10]KKR35985.1 MAG: CoA-substrate-specific enzyme activase [candidate division CPR2 bacterium GW2011_GWC1_39_9]
MARYLGVDVGSVSTNLVLTNEENEVVSSIYLLTEGEPIKAVQNGMSILKEEIGESTVINGVGTTGSGRVLTGHIVGADVIYDEITAHGLAAAFEVSNVNTVLEIGGQDSKIIFIKDRVIVDFAMNSVCAAGTGSFLDHQASRLKVPIESFGELALKATNSCHIAGRCSVFAESDMIHKQQLGYDKESIIYGLCQALVRNYLNNLAKGKKIGPVVIFQGGVAANAGMKRAFEEALGIEIIIPKHYNVMGALGMALYAKAAAKQKEITNFKGFHISETEFLTRSFKCKGCENQCEVVRIMEAGKTIAFYGGRCGKWETADAKLQETEEILTV